MISIVVLVYKSELFLSKCLDSISKQTYSDYEVVFVCKGNSFDKCINIIRAEKRIKRKKIIYQDKGKVSDARNLGIKCSSGKYLTFIDSDDYVSSDYLESLMINMTPEVDFVISLPCILKNKNSVNFDCLYQQKKDREIFNVSTSLLIKLPVVAWGKLYRTRLLKKNKVSCPENVCFEDNSLFWCYASICRKICVIRKNIYFYIQHDGSLIDQCKRNDDQVGFDLIINLRFILDFFECNSKEILITSELLSKYYLESLMFLNKIYEKKLREVFSNILKKFSCKVNNSTIIKIKLNSIHGLHKKVMRLYYILLGLVLRLKL